MTAFDTVYKLARQVERLEAKGDLEQAQAVEQRVRAICSSWTERDWDAYVEETAERNEEA
jgi:hypothetical protein